MLEDCKNEYRSRICKVQDYIEENYFQHVSVEKLADVAGFSQYHFSRIFKSILKIIMKLVHMPIEKNIARNAKKIYLFQNIMNL